MTPEQLASARATHWREDAQPILTLDDAKAWLERMHLCLYLPRKNHVMAPAPSFAGAVLGASSATPSPETIAQAEALLVRLVVEGFVVPLNLFGTPGEQPDFLIVTTALPHLAALQADRTWKKPPARTGPGKVSPLAIEIWKLLDREGALTAIEIREQLGRELTEAAAIRGLSELWQNLRVAPLPQGDGQPAVWEILAVTHKKEMAAGSTMAQSTALSLMVSYYVQSVLTATAEDVEAFLSPVASRSRLRDVIRGLSATRQLHSLSMDAQTFLFIEGTLPDTPEVVAAGAEEKPAFMGRSAYRERMLNKGTDEEAASEDTSPRTYRERREDASAGRPRYAASSERPRPSAPGSASGNASGKGPSRFGGAAGASRPSRPSFGDRARSGPRPPLRGADGKNDRPGSSRPFAPRGGAARPAAGGAFSGRPTSFRPRAEGDRPRPTRSSGDRPFQSRQGARPPFRGKPAEGDARPFRPRAEGDGRSYDRPRTDRPRTNRPGTGRPGADRPRTDRPRTDRPRIDRPRIDRSGSSRPGTAPRSGRPSFDRPRPGGRGDAVGAARPFRPRSDGDRPRPDRPRPERFPSDRAGSDRPRGDRPFPSREGSRPPFQGKPREGAARPYRPRTDGDRPRSDRPRTDHSPSDRPRGEKRSFTPREGSARPPFRGKPADGAARPFRPRAEGDRPRPSGSADRPRSSGSSSSGRPAGPPTGRPSSRPAGAAGRAGANSAGAARPPRTGGSFPKRPGTPGRNPGGTGRPGGPKFGSARPGGAARPGGMRPPTRKPRKPGSDSE